MSSPGAKPVMRPTIIVCVNQRLRHDTPSCAQRGGEAIADALEARIPGTGASLVRIKCFGRCADGPIVRIAPGGRFFTQASLDDVPDMLAALKPVVDPS